METSEGGLFQNNNVIVVHFNEDDLDQASAENRDFYQLIDTKGTLEITDDTVELPQLLTGVVYDDVANTVTLTYATIPDGTYRLRIGVSDQPSILELVVADGIDDNSSFDSSRCNCSTPGNTENILDRHQKWLINRSVW